ncbi:putative L-aspartate dehydrogenase [Candidatus Gugararchaeum adminiculabundum]|nr:putative L-aspartate dehydrogenase [Candidatus Gugararchaeum adminiculabundum]
MIGIGAIGSFLAKNLGKELIWIYDADKKHAQQKVKELKLKCEVVDEPRTDVDLVVEAASQSAVPSLVKILEKTSIMIMSVGALGDDALLERLMSTAKKHGTKIYIPSGAIGGLDAIKSVRDHLDDITLETIKNPSSLGRTDTKRTIIFEGSARKAVEVFPQNVNVAMTLSLCGLGPDKTRVVIISDPSVHRNRHIIKARGDMGEFEFTVKNVPSPDNPKTSALAALSALRVIKERDAVLRIG